MIKELGGKFNMVEEDTKVIWDIYLERGISYKTEIMTNHSVCTEMRKRIQTHSYPKFIWISRARSSKGKLLFDLVYDASDTPSGFCCFQMNYFDPEFRDCFRFMVNWYFSAKNEPIELRSMAWIFKPILHEGHHDFFINNMK